MNRLLNTLYITTPGLTLRKDWETIAISKGSEKLANIPFKTISSIVLFGNTDISNELIYALADEGISQTLLSFTGRFVARIEGGVSGNVLLRKRQYELYEMPEVSGPLAAGFLIGKLANCRYILERAKRDYPDHHPSIPEASNSLKQNINRLKSEQNMDTIRGIEGESAARYFGCFAHLLRNPDFTFNGRNRRPPRDSVNCLLSFAYTILMHDCRSALEAVGLDPQVGYLHRIRPGRASLALDLMEELRPVFADSLALRMINLGIVSKKDFETTPSGGILMKDNARKSFIDQYQTRKRSTIEHPFTGEKIELGLVPLLQARLLARYIRGDMDGYPPYIRK